MNKYYNITDAQLCVIVEETIKEISNYKSSPLDTIIFPTNELKQYILETLSTETRDDPYDTSIPEENFRRRIILAALYLAECRNDTS